MYEFTIARPLIAQAKLERVILDHPTLSWKTLYNNIGGGRHVILAHAEGDRPALAALRRKYVEDPPEYMERLEVIRQTSRYLLLFSVEWAGRHPLDFAVLVEKTLGPETASSGRKDATGAHWHFLTPYRHRIHRFLEALTKAYDAFETKTGEKLPRYVVESYSAAGAFSTGGEGLSPKEANVVEAAVRLGYYDRPRRVTMAGVARTLGIPASTVQYNLSNAERKIVLASLPSLDRRPLHRNRRRS